MLVLIVLSCKVYRKVEACIVQYIGKIGYHKEEFQRPPTVRFF